MPGDVLSGQLQNMRVSIDPNQVRTRGASFGADQQRGGPTPHIQHLLTVLDVDSF